MEVGDKDKKNLKIFMPAEQPIISEFLEALMATPAYQHAKVREYVDSVAVTLRTYEADGGEFAGLIIILDAVKKRLADLLAEIEAAQSPDLLTGLLAKAGDLDKTLESLYSNLRRNYQNMKDALVRFGYRLESPALPDFEKILDLVKELAKTEAGLETLLSIKKPVILITPNDSLDNKIANLGKHPNNKITVLEHVEDQKPDSFVSPVPFWGKSEKMTISIVDLDHVITPFLVGQNGELDNEHKAQNYHLSFARKGLKIISAHEYAMLQMLTLWMEEAIDDGAYTILNFDHLMGSVPLKLLPVAEIESQCLSFRAAIATHPDGLGTVIPNLYSRPSLKLMEADVGGDWEKSGYL